MLKDNKNTNFSNIYFWFNTQFENNAPINVYEHLAHIS